VKVALTQALGTLHMRNQGLYYETGLGPNDPGYAPHCRDDGMVSSLDSKG
jgi:hypothetical protein